MSSESDIHQYMHSVLERDDHGPHRLVMGDLATLNDAIQQHTERIVLSVGAKAKEIVVGGDGDKVTLKNHLGNVSFQCFLETPKNLDQLMQVMVKAKQANLTVKAIGGFYAFSPVCETTGYAIKTDDLVGTSPTPTTYLKNPSQEGLYEILCGTSFKQAIETLEKDKRALMNLGGFTGQGNIGATATGTHGSGLTIPPLASMIIGINLVSGQFDPNSGLPIRYRIEPTNGISDPKLYPAPWIVIQDDKDFNAVMTGLGAMGVIYSATFTTVPFYWVREIREIIDWPKARKMLDQGPQGDILKYHNAEVWVNPYTSHTLLSRREVVTTKPADELSGPNLNIHHTLVEKLTSLRVVTANIFDCSISDHMFEELGVVLALFLRLFPLLVPCVMNLALVTQNHSQPRVAKYYDIYDIGFAHNFPAISTEISHPMTMYLPAADAAISLLKKLRKKNMRQAVLSPISLRFTADTPASLSMSYSAKPSQYPGRNYLELPSLINFYPSIQTFDDVSRPISEQSITKFQGRLHWGQYITPDFTSLEYQPKDPDYFASIASFKAVAEKFDPGHLMSNKFLNKVIWLQAPPMV